MLFMYEDYIHNLKYVPRVIHKDSTTDWLKITYIFC